MTEQMEMLIMELRGYHDKYRGDANRAKGAMLAKRAADALVQQDASIESMMNAAWRQDKIIEELTRRLKSR